MKSYTLKATVAQTTEGSVNGVNLTYATLLIDNGSEQVKLERFPDYMHLRQGDQITLTVSLP